MSVPQRSLLDALEPINPHGFVDRIPGIDAPCLCEEGRQASCGWPFCGPIRESLNASPASAPCPKCSERGNMQYRWKPDRDPTTERLQCYGCGWDTGWITYGTCKVVAA